MALTYSGMAVCELNLANKSLTCSEGFDQLMGSPGGDKKWTADSLIKKFLPEDQNGLRDLLSDIRPDQQFDYQGRIYTPDGIVKWINFQGRAEDLESGHVRVLGTLYDITRDKLSERDKDDFISIASHELKTPLTALNGTLQILQRMKEGSKHKMAPMIDQAGKSMKKITALVDDLLNASRLNESQLVLRRLALIYQRSLMSAACILQRAVPTRSSPKA